MGALDKIYKFIDDTTITFNEMLKILLYFKNCYPIKKIMSDEYIISGIYNFKDDNIYYKNNKLIVINIKEFYFYEKDVIDFNIKDINTQKNIYTLSLPSKIKNFIIVIPISNIEIKSDCFVHLEIIIQ